MNLICAECGREMVVDGMLQDGDIVACPSCGLETEYRKPSRIAVPTGFSGRGGKSESPAESLKARPKLRVIRKDTPTKGGTPISNVPLPNQARHDLPPKPPRPRAQKTGGSGGGGSVSLLLVLLVLGATYWGYRTFVSERADIEEQPVTTDQKQSGLDEAEKVRRQKAEEEEALRQRERQREKERKERERAEARAEMARNAEAEKANRQAYRVAMDAFSGKSSYFAVGVPKDEIPDPRQTDEALTFWAADKSFCEQGLIYEIQTGAGGIASVRSLSASGSPTEVGKDEFVQRLESGVWAVSTGEAVWILGTGKSARLVPLPKDREDVCPMGDELGEAMASIMALHMKLPDVRYRLSLKPKSGGEGLPLGIISGRERLPFVRMREAVKKVVAERQAAQALAKLKKPKAKRFKPTVIFYDGSIISKSLNGVTRVPRSFTYLGTSRGNNYSHVNDIRERAREKWEKMRAEAERQERKAREVEAENAAALQAYKRKRAELSRNVDVSDRDVEAELARYGLLVERSRTKIPD